MGKKYPFLLSIITDEISQDPEVAIELVEQYGVDGVELRSVWNSPIEELPDDRIRVLAERLKKSGIQVSAISSSLLKTDWALVDFEKYSRLVNACKILDCSTIRAFSFWKSEKYTDDKFALILETLDNLLEKDNLQMVIENDPAVNLSTGMDLASFFRKNAYSRIGILWDPGNDIYTCGSAICPYPDEYQAVKQYVRHVHVKDAVHRNGEGIGVALGEGWMDFIGQFEALKSDQYSGWVVLEPHYRLEGGIAEDLLKRPGGAAFSENGYLPSKICMENLVRMLDQISMGK